MTVENSEEVLDTGNEGQDSHNPPESPDDGGGEGGNGHDETVSKAELEKQIQQRRKANREAVEAKKRAEALEAKVREYEDKDKTELEKLQAEREELAKRAEAAERKAAETERTSAVVLAGAKKGSAARYIASELAAAESEDSNLDRDAWLAEFRKDNPEFFADTRRAPGAAEGGPASGAAKTLKRDALIKEHEEAIERTRNPHEKLMHKRAIRILRGKASDSELNQAVAEREAQKGR